MAQKPQYEFLGPPGAFFISFILPLLVYAATFACNDVSGCPAPSLLHPSTLTLETLKKEVGWPGVTGLLNTQAAIAVVGYYVFSGILNVVLPAEEVQGVELRSGGRLQYRFNGFYSSIFTLSLLAAGTALQGADWIVWTFIYDNYVQLLTANLVIAYALATFVYIRSFSVKEGNKDKRELAQGGNTGNVLYDWFIGRELNPRVTLPFFGEIDIKSFMEVRPGLLGWIILDFAFAARQYRTYGYITNSMLIVLFSQTLYSLDAVKMEPAILTTIDIIMDGFGFMLSFGDLVWVQFMFTWQTKYLAVHPVNLTYLECAGIFAVQAIGYYIFRASNNQKNRFRTNPNDPRVAHLKYIETKTGSRLITSGWWGAARHINYLGDWTMSWAYCLPTGIAGYIIQHNSPVPAATGQSATDGSFIGGKAAPMQVVQGEARGWGMIVTYFFMIYFGVLLIHRERRDEEKCRKKYGKDWEEYCKKVPSRIIPGVY